jgi:tripartite-type tricarboxylate transporter receptor subunit TctC
VVGTNFVRSAPADGYTVLNFATPFLLAPYVTKGVSYSPAKEFTAINMSLVSPNVVYVKKDSPWTTFNELIADAKKNPGKFTCSISAYGGSGHISSEILKVKTGIDFTMVPLDGSGPSVTAVLGGHLDFGLTELVVVQAYLQAGSLRGLALWGENRHKGVPQVPTTVEQGFPDLIRGSLQGFVVRAETPRVIVQRLNKIFKEALSDRAVIELQEKSGSVIVNLGSEDAAEFLSREQKIFSEVANVAKIVPK